MVRLPLLCSFCSFSILLLSCGFSCGEGTEGAVIGVDHRWGLISRGRDVNRTSLVYALQNWLSESSDQAARKPSSNPGILGVAMGFMAVIVVCLSFFSKSQNTLLFFINFPRTSPPLPLGTNGPAILSY